MHGESCECQPEFHRNKVAGRFKTQLEREIHKAFMLRAHGSNLRICAPSITLSDKGQANISQASDTQNVMSGFWLFLHLNGSFVRMCGFIFLCVRFIQIQLQVTPGPVFLSSLSCFLFCFFVFCVILIMPLRLHYV